MNNERWVRLFAIGAVILITFNLGCDSLLEKKKGFVLHDPANSGIDFNNALDETHEMNIISYPDFYSGGGVSIGDIDNDSLPDLFFTGNQVDAKLYKNLGGFKFQDVTELSKLDKMGRGWYTGTCMVDINADGYLDIYVSKSGMEAPEDRANLLFINNQDGTFTERAKEMGLDNMGYGVNAVFFDYDKDGDLDAYIANQVSARLNSREAEELRNVVHPYAGDKLYENVDGFYSDVTEQAGLFSSQVGFAHGAAVGDINNDGWEDLFVSNDFFEYDYLYINNKDKTFTESIKSWANHISHFSMGNDLADFNNDGLLDLMVLDMVAEDNRRMYANTGGLDEERFMRNVQHGLHFQYMYNVLHLNNGNNTFSEMGMLAGVSRTDWSWAPLFADFDNDGFKDLYVTNGLRKDIRNIDWGITYRDLTRVVRNFTEFQAAQWDMLLNSLPSEQIVNYMYKNNGDLTFTKVMEEWGMEHASWSNGASYGDLDRDGDLDLVVNNVDGAAFVYENRNEDSNFIQFTFRGSEKNPMGLGAKVKIFHGANMQYQQHYISRGYRSSVEPIMSFGLGADTIIQKVEVVWPDGREMLLKKVDCNQQLLLDYEQSVDSKLTESVQPITYFQDVTEQHMPEVKHRENEMIDFMGEPMLQYKVSMLGPALAVSDVNDDGLDDFYLGGAFRSEGQLLIQEKDGSFSPIQTELWRQDRYFEDTGATFFDVDNDGDKDLYVVSGGNEYTAESEFLVDRLYLNDSNGVFSKSIDVLPDLQQCGSIVKPADVDGDGDIDVFIGGRLVPRSYPLPANSYLLINEGGRLVNATGEHAPELIELGMVTDAEWVDLEKDGDLDLVVVGEWMPITFFINNNGKLAKEQSKKGLEHSSGWWWSVEADDLDNDGDVDFVVGNMGLNFKFKPSKNEPLAMFAGHFDQDGKTDFVMAHYQDGQLFPFNDRGKAIRQNLIIKDRIPSNEQYAQSTIYDIYEREVLDSARKFQIDELRAGAIINNGDGSYTFSPFDNLAQISNVNSIVIRDVDNDGNKDAVLAGNLFPMEAETIRNDAGIGTWMKANGHGNFEAIPFMESGLDIGGDVRNMTEISIGSDRFLIIAKNNDLVQLVKITGE